MLSLLCLAFALPYKAKPNLATAQPDRREYEHHHALLLDYNFSIMYVGCRGFSRIQKTSRAVYAIEV